MKGNTGTLFALACGGLLLYFLTQALKPASGAVQNVFNTGQ